MNLINCRLCGVLVRQRLGDLCNGCVETQENRYTQVYSHLQANPELSLDELAAAFNLPSKSLAEMICRGEIKPLNAPSNNQCKRCAVRLMPGNRINGYCVPCNRAMLKAEDGNTFRAFSEAKAMIDAPRLAFQKGTMPVRGQALTASKNSLHYRSN